MVELDEATILLITCVVVVFGTPIILKSFHMIKNVINADPEEAKQRGGKRKKQIIEDEWGFEAELAEELGIKRDEEEDDPKKKRKKKRRGGDG